MFVLKIASLLKFQYENILKTTFNYKWKKKKTTNI